MAEQTAVAGKLEVLVEADLTGFRKRLKKGVEAASKGVNAKVGIEFKDDADDVRAKLETIVTAASKGVNAKVGIEVDERDTRSRIQRMLNRTAKRVKPLKVATETDNKLAQQIAAETAAAEAQAAGAPVSVPVETDGTLTREVLAEMIKAELAARAAGGINVPINPTLGRGGGFGGGRWLVRGGLLASIGSLIQPAVGALSAGVGGLAAAGGAAAPALGVLAGAAPGIATLVQSMVGLTVAMGGTGKAIGLLAEKERILAEGGEWTKEQQEQLAAALDMLSPSARTAVREIAGLRGEWINLRQAVQENFFAEIADDIAPLANRFLPTLRKGLEGTAKTGGQVAERFLEWMDTPAFNSRFGRVLASNNKLFGAMGGFLFNATDGMLAFLDAARPFTKLMGNNLREAGRWFNQNMQQGARDGSIAWWLDKAADRAGLLWNTVKQLGGGFAGIFRAGDSVGMSLLTDFDEFVTRWHEWVDSPEGQVKIQDWFQGVEPAARELALIVRDIGLGLVDWADDTHVVDMLRQFRTELMPALGDLLSSLGEHLGPTVIDFLTQLTRLLNNLEPATRVLIALLQGINALADGLNNLAEANPGLAGVAAALLGIYSAGKLLGKVLGSKVFSGVLGAMLAGGTAAKGAGAGRLGILGGIASGLFGIGRAADDSGKKVGRLRGLLTSRASGVVGGVGLLAAGASTANDDLSTMSNILGSIALGFGVGGPWGAVIGGVAAIGQVAAAGNDEIMTTLSSLNELATSGASLSQMFAGQNSALGDLDDFKTEIDFKNTEGLSSNPFADLDRKFAITKNMFEDMLGQSDAEEAQAEYDEAAAAISRTEGAARGLAKAFGVNIFGTEANQLAQLDAVLNRVQPTMARMGITREDLTNAWATQNVALAEGGVIDQFLPEGHELRSQFDDLVDQIMEGGGRLDAALGRVNNLLSRRGNERALKDAFAGLTKGLKDGFTRADAQNLDNAVASISRVAATIKNPVKRESFLMRAQADLLRIAQGAGPKARAQIEGIIRALRRMGLFKPPKISPNVDVKSFRKAEKAFESLPEEVKSHIRTEGIPQTKAEIDKLVAKYKLTEEERKALVTLKDAASPSIQHILRQLALIRDKSVTITTTYVSKRRTEAETTPGRAGPQPAYESADGGFITGPGTSTSDSIPAMLSDGEFVIRAKAVRRYGRMFFERLNAMRARATDMVRHRGGRATGAERILDLDLTTSRDRMDQVGRGIGAGLAAGLRRGAKGVRDAVEATTEALRKDNSAEDHRRRNEDEQRRERDNDDRHSRAKERHARRLREAQRKLDQLRGKRKSLTDSIRQGFDDYASLSSITGSMGGFASPTAIIGSLTDRLTKSRGFRANLKSLRKKGLGNKLYRQLLEMGVEAGAPIVDQLKNATPEQLKRIQRLQNKLGSIGKGMSKKAGNELYKQAIDAADALVRRLKRRHKEGRDNMADQADRGKDGKGGRRGNKRERDRETHDRLTNNRTAASRRLIAEGYGPLVGEFHQHFHDDKRATDAGAEFRRELRRIRLGGTHGR